MELSNEFVVPVGVDEAWVLLTDVERIAPCMPGAQLTEIEGDEYRGVVKVKVGPITAQYKGKATFVEKDDAAHKAVLRAEGRDTRGQGNANATITATLVTENGGTRVTVVTDLASAPATETPAEVGASREGAAASAASSSAPSGPTTREPGGASDAALAGGASGSNGSRSSDSGSAATVSSGPRQVMSRPAEPVDLLGTAGSPVVKRLLPALVGALLAFIVGRRLRRWRRG
jgi:carbon monoxide dehydrogenase subunit G